MIKLIQQGVYYKDNNYYTSADNIAPEQIIDAYKKTMTYDIISQHNTVDTIRGQGIKLKFDAIASHDITYVGIIQTAKASGLKSFPIPYVLTNCHNSLCAVGGTINEDDHIFGLSAAKKYGAIYVPSHLAVIHTYMRERMAGCKKMILGSDSHTRYGAIGTMAIGEGGPELVKQILSKTYDTIYPDVIAVRLNGTVRRGVGPQDVALAIIKAVFANGFVKNKVMEFVGEGIASLPIEFRNGIDVMTTETTCLSSIWMTDDVTREYLATHQRENEYIKLQPEPYAYYDGLIDVDLSTVEPMIALPFHPSNVYTLREVIDNPYKILKKCEDEGNALLANPNITFKLVDKIVDGKIKVDQAIIAGCAGGTYDNIYEASRILQNKSIGNTLSMSVYCGSQPIYLDLIKKGVIEDLVVAGANIKTAFCGPCFGAGDVPSNNGFSIRHTTRNFESREGSKPSDRQIASVALMDARSIAATAANGGYLTSALDLEYDNVIPKFSYSDEIYNKRVYQGFNNPQLENELVYGPNIADWPKMIALQDNLIMKVAAVINDAVTTTDELIPSGETSSYRSNPFRLAEFTLSRKCPQYVSYAKAISKIEEARKEGNIDLEVSKAISTIGGLKGTNEIGSVIYATKPGDGSAREQAASCQRVLGGVANISIEYATKRYRSNLINWGMLPLKYDNSMPLQLHDFVIIPNVANILTTNKADAFIVRNQKSYPITLTIDPVTKSEQGIILAGCLINYNNI